MYRNRRRAPLGVLAGLVLVALATIGVVYGLWSKNLLINGTVQTGDLNVDWSFVSCGELHGWPGPFVQGEYLDKDVGWIEWEIGDPDWGNQVLNVWVYNAYPSYVADCQVELTNTGTIPVNMVGLAVAPGAALTNCSESGGAQSRVVECDQMTIIFVDNIGLQVDPGDSVASSLRLHVEQPAEQSSPDRVVEYGFKVKLCAAQWNEEATYQECIDSPQHEGPPD